VGWVKNISCDDATSADASKGLTWLLVSSTA